MKLKLQNILDTHPQHEKEIMFSRTKKILKNDKSDEHPTMSF